MTPAGAQHYWDERGRRFAHQGPGWRAVCSYGMPAFYNRYIHWTQALALAPWLRVGSGETVLEIGCGVGRWTLQMSRRGAQVTGLDLSPVMLAEAQRRLQAAGLQDRCRLLQGDVAELELGRRFDRILCVTVLQHILDEARFGEAMCRLARHLSPEGRLVLLEAAPSSHSSRCDSAVFRARTAAQFEAAGGRAGLHCLGMRGVDPAPFKTMFLPHYGRLPRPLAWAGLAAATGLSIPVDLLAGRKLVRLSWHKIMLFKAAEAG